MSIIAVLFSLAVLRSTVASAEPAATAFIKRVYPEGTKVSDAVQISRAGKVLVLSEAFTDLQSGDRVLVKLGAVTIMIVDTGTVTTLTQGQSFEVPQPIKGGSSAAFVAWIKALTVGPDRSARVVAVTRGGPSRSCYNASETSVPNPFTIPILGVEQPVLAGGKRALFVTWTGGRPPFRVELLHTKANAVAARATVADACSVRLPEAELVSGAIYRLSVTDANGSVLSENNLWIEPTLPAMPAELRNAPVEQATRALLFATWLATAEAGRWAFEAHQQVAALGCSNPAARTWLQHWAAACPSP